MRTRRVVLLLALVAAVVGVVLTQPWAGPTDDFGWFAYAPGDDTSVSTSVMFAGGWAVSTSTLIGSGLVWLATMLAAGVAGHWWAGRPSRAG